MTEIKANVGCRLVVCMHDKEDSRAKITLEGPSTEELKVYNEQGYGIFETANAFLATKEQVEALRIKKNKQASTKRQKEFLSQLLEVYADLDVTKEGDGIPETEREEMKSKLLTELKAHCPASSYVITKNGIQPHWRIDEPSVDQGTQEAYTDVIKGITQWSKRHGSKGDPIHDVTRFLRLPGFYHHKGEPYLVTEEPGTDKMYTLDELKASFPLSKAVTASRDIITPAVATNSLYQQVRELDIERVAIDAWREIGHEANFDDKGHLVVDGQVTATFKGKLGNGNYMATTSGDYPAKGDPLEYATDTLKMNRREAFNWLCGKYGIGGQSMETSKNVIGALSDPVTAEQLGREEFAPETWVVDRLVPENQITVISGASSSFKTMSVLDWALSVAVEGKAYGQFNTLKSPVMFISEDGDHKRVIQKRIKLLAGSGPNNLYLWLGVGFRVTESSVRDLLTKVRKYAIRFIIFDSLRGIVPSEFKEIDANSVRQLINMLRPITTAGATILIIHHDRKKPASGRGYTSKDPGDLGEMMSGSGDVRAAVDCHLSMRSGKDKKSDQDYIVVTQTKCRQEELLPPFRVLINKEMDEEGKTTKLCLVYDSEYAPDNAEETIIKAKEAILELLAKSNDKYVCRQVIIEAEPAGLKSRKVDEALASLENDDKTIASKTGKELGKLKEEARRKFYYIPAEEAED